MKLFLTLLFLVFLGLNLLIVMRIVRSTHELHHKASKVNFLTVREFRNDGFQLLGGAVGGVVFVFIFSRIAIYFGNSAVVSITTTFEIIQFLVLMFCVATIIFLVASKEYIQMPEDETEMSSAYSPAPREY